MLTNSLDGAADAFPSRILVQNACINVAEEVLLPGTVEPRHRHNVASQVFYVLAGTATLEVEDEIIPLGETQFRYISRGEAHAIMNHGIEPVRLLVVTSPMFPWDRIDDA